MPARAARRRAQAAGRARARAARGAQPYGRAGAAVRPQGIADTRIVHPHMYAQEFVMRASNTLQTLKYLFTALLPCTSPSIFQRCCVRTLWSRFN